MTTKELSLTWRQLSKRVLRIGIGTSLKLRLVWKVFSNSNAIKTNPIKNSVISGFSGQKSGTRIILSILQSFLHKLKAESEHRNQFLKGTRENVFQSSENVCKHRQNCIISFILPVLSSVSYEVQHCLQHHVNNLGIGFLSTCYSNSWWILS